MTENVYIIKVKTRPPLLSLYPSERRYSASTVGGLSLVHFGLGALSFLLGAFALSLQGPILSVACLVPFVTGLLAWRRWYIDRNIAVFFYGSLFSLIIAILCFVITIFDIAAVSGNTGGSLWPLEKILDAPRYSPLPSDSINGTRADNIASSGESPFNITHDHDPVDIDESHRSPLTLILSSIELNESGLHDNAKNVDYEDLKSETTFTSDARITSEEILQEESKMNITRESREVSLMKEKAGSFWRNRYKDSSHTRTLLTLNVLVTSLLEIFWSLLSAKIAFRGMTNLPESNNVVASSKTTRLPLQKRKPPAPRPDILDHDRRLSESLQHFANLQSLAGPGPRLPLPESSREFRERVERFLANQATHRIVEGA